MDIGHSEIQLARAIKANYEQFLIALFLFRNFSEASLEKKKETVIKLREMTAQDQMQSPVFVMTEDEDLPLPSDQVFLDCLEAVGIVTKSGSITEHHIAKEIQKEQECHKESKLVNVKK